MKFYFTLALATILMTGSTFAQHANIGFKAGNLQNGIENSSGDLFVILDADARPFPAFLKNTLGYFRKQRVAWVQTCQWLR